MTKMAVFLIPSPFISALSIINGMQKIERRAQEYYNQEDTKVKSHAVNLLFAFILIYHNRTTSNVKVRLQMPLYLRDTENADIPIMAPGFGSDFVELIEQNRRRSQCYVEDFATEARRNMARRRDAKTGYWCFPSP